VEAAHRLAEHERRGDEVERRDERGEGVGALSGMRRSTKGQTRPFTARKATLPKK